MARGGGVNATTSRQTRDEGSNKEGKDSKGNGNATAVVLVWQQKQLSSRAAVAG